MAVNQRLPSLSSTIPCGPETGVFMSHSLVAPVFGSIWPILLLQLPLYQSRPSFVASPSCGREPSVGILNSFIDTFTAPVMILAGGTAFSEKFAARYVAAA